MPTIQRLVVTVSILTMYILSGSTPSHAVDAAPNAACKPLVNIAKGSILCYAPSHALEAGRHMAFTPIDPIAVTTHAIHVQLKQVLLWSSRSPTAHVVIPSSIFYVFGSPSAAQYPGCKTHARARFLLVEENPDKMKPVTARGLCNWQVHINVPGSHISLAIGSDGPAANAVALAKLLRDRAVTQQRPLPSATATPTATAPASGNSPIVALAKNGSTLTLNVGDHFLLNLGSSYIWSVHVSPPLIVAKANDLSAPIGTQGYYSAVAAGQTMLSAVGNPTCSTSVPPCERPSILFRLNIVVRATSAAAGSGNGTTATSTATADTTTSY